MTTKTPPKKKPAAKEAESATEIPSAEDLASQTPPETVGDVEQAEAAIVIPDKVNLGDLSVSDAMVLSNLADARVAYLIKNRNKTGGKAGTPQSRALEMIFLRKMTKQITDQLQPLLEAVYDDGDGDDE